MPNKFNELLLMYKYDFTPSQIEKIGSFWEKYIDFGNISESNFLSSKYALSIGDVSEFLINKFPFIEKEILRGIVSKIKMNHSFRFANNGIAFQYFCYSLFKDYNTLKITDETKGGGEPSMDFGLTTNQYELEIKTIQMESMEDKFNYLEQSILKLFGQADFSGQFYISLTFYNQKIDADLLEMAAKKTLVLLNVLLEKIKITDYALLAEDFEKKIYNFCLIKIHYQPKNMHFNEYWIGGDLAGWFCDAHNITKNGGGFCLSIDHITIDIESYVRNWCKKKLSNKPGAIFFSFTNAIYDDAAINNAFVKIKSENPNLIALFHVDLWDEDKLAKVKIYCNQAGDAKEVIGQFNENRVKLEIIENARFKQ